MCLGGGVGRAAWLFEVQGYLMNWEGRFACPKDQKEKLLRLFSSES